MCTFNFLNALEHAMVSSRDNPLGCCCFGCALGFAAFFAGGTGGIVNAIEPLLFDSASGVAAPAPRPSRVPLSGSLSFGGAANGVSGLFNGGTGALIDKER